MDLLEIIRNPMHRIKKELQRDKLLKRLEKELAGKNENKLLSRKEASDFLNISVRKLDQLKANGEIEAVKIGRKVGYRRRALNEFVQKNAHIEDPYDL